MESNIKITQPKYLLIALDIARKIVEGSYNEKDKLYARSSLASQYAVSAETARRAICVLSDLGIAESVKGSGVIIKSTNAAKIFIRQNKDTQTILDIKSELQESVKKQKEEMDNFAISLNKLIEKTEKFRLFNPFIPFQIEITKETVHLDKTIGEINFWHNTFATIVAIRRSSEMLLSPGPYISFKEGDTIFFVGDDTCHDRVNKFLYKEK